MEIVVSKATVRRVLFVAMAIVTSAGLLAEILKSTLHMKGDQGLVPVFSLSYEGNVPTWYSSALLLACSLLLFAIASGARRRAAPYAGHWIVLALGFLYISLDEVVSIHEHAGFLRLSGVLYFSWVVPAAVIVVALGLSYLRFLKHLPRGICLQFIIAGAIYVTGALVMELPLGYWTERAGTDNLTYGMIDLVEESMEILGVTLFLLALVEYLGREGYRVAFAPEASDDSVPPIASSPAPKDEHS